MENDNIYLKYVDINEASEELGVSTGTVRNWIHSAKLVDAVKINKKLYLHRDKVCSLKQEIFNGKIPNLQSRRNKRAVKGHIIPVGYVDSNKINEFNENLLKIFIEGKNRVTINLILMEIVLNLMAETGKISFKVDAKGKSLVWMFFNGHINCGHYTELLGEPIYNNSIIGDSETEFLLKVRNLGIPSEKGKDLLGLVYMSLSNSSERISNGAYYTPSPVVEQLVQKSLPMLEKEFPRVLDPCCGSGNFLLRVFYYLRMRLVKNGYSSVDAERKILEEGIFGSDIDPIAVWLCKINLLLFCEGNIIPVRWNIRSINPLLYDKYEISGEFDLIIGNPPWGSDLAREDMPIYREKYITAGSSCDSFSLFIEYALNILQDKGIVAYILPESILKVKTHYPVRKMLLEKTHIQAIEKLGNKFFGVFAPAVSLIARKIKEKSSDHKIQVNLLNERSLIIQSRFENNHSCFFNIWTSERDQQILKHLGDLDGKLTLKDYADFALGIVTGNNKKLLLNERPEGGETVLTGSQVYKYNYYPQNSYLIFNPEAFQQTAPEAIYRVQEKLLYRFINDNLIFAYDDQKTLAINSVNILVPRIPGYAVKYILAVLNSRTVQYYYRYSFDSVKILRAYIESIPIPSCENKRQTEIIKLVDELLTSERADRRIELYEEIDSQIMQLYQLDKKDKLWIKQKTGEIKYIFK